MTGTLVSSPGADATTASDSARSRLRLIPPSPDARCSAVVARQFSLWPFGTRTLRLFLLVDPSRLEPVVMRGVLRAMQEAFFRAETGSQTGAVRAAALAAHYVLRHHNHGVLPLEQITASVAVGATRGRTAYVCLVGDAAAFALRGGVLTGQRSTTRLLRRAGLEQDPRVTLWSTPFERGDRLVLVCGAPVGRSVPETVVDVVSNNRPSEAQERLSTTLSRPGCLVRALVSEAGSPVPADPRLKLVSMQRQAPLSGRKRIRRLLALALPLAILCAAALVVLSRTAEVPSIEAGQRAQDLLAQVDGAPDIYAAHSVAANALNLASRAATTAPDTYSPLLEQVAQKLDGVDRVVPVDPAVAVRLGPGAANVVDLAAADDAIYTLDPVEATVRTFAADSLEQVPTQQTVLVSRGATVGARRLATPIAMEYLPLADSREGELVVVDEGRTVVQRASDGSISTQALPSSGTWQQLGALGAGSDGALFVLDSSARRLLAYSSAGQQLADPPRLMLNGGSALDDVGWQHVAEVASVKDLYLRLDDGHVRRFDQTGQPLRYDVQAPDGPLTAVTAMAPDRSGGLYLADPTHARIVQTTADGGFVRQLRAAALTGVRVLQSSPDGHRLYALVPAGVLAFDAPASE
ncbi:MAG: hypothetical protein JOZ81_17215 [Chloroflexi bacterium]|nr:hypothetical protein [Chloroflexota bacterium]MBV9543247.1 hypothetical protein [Chloroflexota bacterium]